MAITNMNGEFKTLFQGRHLQLVQQGRWEYVERVNISGGVAIVAVTPDGRLLLTEQFRIPLSNRVIELPAGLIEAGESPANAASRELMEETGYQASQFAVLATSPSSAGLTSELVTFVQASELKKTGMGGGIDDESITVHEVSLSELHGWLKGKAQEGLVIDSKIFSGLWLMEKHGLGQ